MAVVGEKRQVHRADIRFCRRALILRQTFIDLPTLQS
jgi:hypothetical protein